MKEIHLNRIDLNLLVVFEVLMDTGSVSAAAKKLNKTPSAISHALSRMREQLDDPLMVNVGGKMTASPYALRLIEDVRPILRTVERAVRSIEDFDPATSFRIFRIAAPFVTSWIAGITSRIHEAAPNVGIEWEPFGPGTYKDVQDEVTDLGLHSAHVPLPGGIREEKLPPLKRYVFARDGHPALGSWSKQAWLNWPHVTVGMSHGAPESVNDRIAKIGVERRIGAQIPDFSGVAALVSGTDMLSNQVAAMLGKDIETYQLRVLEIPEPIPDFQFRFFWSERVSHTLENIWLRNIVTQAFSDLVAEAESLVADRGVIPAS